ncbi:MAG: DUF3326 domain-containing protein [Armatimonadota bacterium]
MLTAFRREVRTRLLPDEVPVRFVINETTDKSHRCDISIVQEEETERFDKWTYPDIFSFLPRKYENNSQFTAMLLIPTGIGAELGGHAGDGGALAKLVCSACDRLITHPNVVNASDINELPENGLYVEGSVISELIMGTVALQEVKANRILLVIEPRQNEIITHLSINSASAVRASIGIDCVGVVELPQRIAMQSFYSESGCAIGQVDNMDSLFDICLSYQGQYDAIALQTGIEVSPSLCDEYLQSQGEIVNPWGGVEAMLTHLLALMMNIPVAHSPMVKVVEDARPFAGVVDPRMSAEVISGCYLISVLKGLHKSPRIMRDPSVIGHSGIISNSDISCLIIPDGCVGIPTLAAMEQGISVIAVRENRNNMRNNLADYPFKPGKLFIVDNYLEAVGVLCALKAGVTVESVRRPLSGTTYIKWNGGCVERVPDCVSGMMETPQ